MEFDRLLDLRDLLKKKSHFLMGPRSTGKSTLIRKQLSGSRIIDLLEGDLDLRLSQHPGDLEAIIEERPPETAIVVIDEIQRVPALLNEVHRLIEKKRCRFLLTGSSARKLKGEKTNLMAGRAWMAHLFPLTWKEMGRHFELQRFLRYGGLPQVVTSRYPEQELTAYVRTYLYEEIRAEAIVRRIPPFSRFLEGAALSNGQMINFANIANDAGVHPSTIREYYQVLEDTLMGFALPPWTHSRKRKAIQTAKFYFFDVGVAHALARIEHLDRNSDLYGRAFEHWIAMELRAYLDYRGRKEALGYWRSVSHQEVDLTLGDLAAIEVKATRKVTDKDLRGLLALQEEGVFKRYYLISQDPLPAKRHGIHCLPWQDFMEALWGDRVVE